MRAAEGLFVHIGSTQHFSTPGTAQLLAGITHQPFKFSVGIANYSRRIDAENGIRALFEHLAKRVHHHITHLDDSIETDSLHKE
jgi:hypothetical protein